jgi:hypothetical protein
LPVVTIVRGFFNVVDLPVATIVVGFFNVVVLQCPAAFDTEGAKYSKVWAVLVMSKKLFFYKNC